MHIGMIAPPWLPVPPPLYGGTEEVVDALATGLAAAGHDVTLFATGDSSCQVPTESVYATAERDRMGATIPELYHTLAAYDGLKECDVIHDHTVAGLFVAAYLNRSGVVATNHGPFTEELQRVYGAVQDRVSIVAVSHDQAARAPDLRIARVIHHGLDPDAFTPGNGGGDYLLFLGRMSPDKGAHRAVRVARAAGRRLLIAAKMQERAERRYFDTQVKPLLGDDVEYVGEPDRSVKKTLLADAEALVNPIHWPEPFGLVMIEALASGTPVLAFAEASAPEIVEDGVTGYLCRDEADMVRALSRLEALDRRDCRRTFEERFTVQNMTRGYLDLYEEVSESRKSDPTAA